MLASHFGSHLSITKIREVAGTDREGTSLKGMLEAAKKLNLDAKAVKGNEQIFSKKFPVPLVAHLQYQNGNNHFVVIAKINEKRVWIYDPALGKISYEKENFLKIWSCIIKICSINYSAYKTIGIYGAYFLGSFIVWYFKRSLF